MALATRCLGIGSLIVGLLGLVLGFAPHPLAALGLDLSGVVEDFRTLQECQQEDELLEAQIAPMQEANEIRAQANHRLLRGQITFAQAAATYQKAALLADDAPETELDRARPFTEEICREVLTQIRGCLVNHPEEGADGLLKRLEREAAELLDSPSSKGARPVN